MQDWTTARKIAKTPQKIDVLKTQFETFLGLLNPAMVAIILDINGGTHVKQSNHYQDQAVDFCFRFECDITNSEVAKAASSAGFNGVGCYFGTKKMSYHIDRRTNSAYWIAVKAGRKWKYRYFNLAWVTR